MRLLTYVGDTRPPGLTLVVWKPLRCVKNTPGVVKQLVFPGLVLLTRFILCPWLACWYHFMPEPDSPPTRLYLDPGYAVVRSYMVGRWCFTRPRSGWKKADRRRARAISECRSGGALA
jgi:hypothetical protein